VQCVPRAPEIPADSSDHAVSATVEGLSAGNTYHWRVVASDSNGTTTSPDHTFVYDTSGGGLPDGRAYEMVSPPHKNGALLGIATFAFSPEVAENGDRVTTVTAQCFGDAESCAAHRGVVGSPYAFTRAPGGWQATALLPSAAQFGVSSPQVGSAETGAALFLSPTAPGGEDDFYVRREDRSVAHLGPLTPPENGPLGAASVGGSAETNDFSHIAWGSPVSWPSFDNTRAGGETVYEYAGVDNVQPFLVGVSGGAGSNDLISKCGTLLGTKHNKAGPMSADGSTVYFTALGGVGCSGSGTNEGTPVPADELYARVNGERPDAHTVAISVPSPGECGSACQASPPSNAQYWYASADGAKAFFTSSQQLTDEASSGQENLYLYDFANAAGHNLIDVSAGAAVTGGPHVTGVVGISPDGSHAYFLAQGVLTASPNMRGQTARQGASNLYVFERDAVHPQGQIAFIASARLSTELSAKSPSNVTPDGRFLVFTSSERLTADDTSMSGAQQVFRYDSQTRQLVRLSVGNGGFNDNGNRPRATPCNAQEQCSEDAHTVPPESRSRRDPTMSDDGAYVFFQSPVALTPQALDDVLIGTRDGTPEYAQNVYEWHEGHVSLISDGHDTSRDTGQAEYCGGPLALSSVCLLGASSDGSNVFFSTADRLLSADIDEQLDYYDARICTAADPCIEPAPSAPQPCLGEACHGTPPAPPGLLTPGSSTFDGAGNIAPPVNSGSKPTAAQLRAKALAKALRACRRKHNKHKRAVCEKKAHKRYGRSKAKKANRAITHRGAAR
jgi:hypothetical protein